MITIDNKSLQSSLQKWASGVNRYVDELGIEAETALKTQIGYLMRDLSERIPPTRKEKLESRIEKDVNAVFAPESRIMFRGAQRGHGDILWLDAGPKWVTGIKRQDYRPQATPDQMTSMYSARSGRMGVKYEFAGFHGKQRVQLLNRILVKKNSIRQFSKNRKTLVGKLKASFIIAWDHLSPKGKRPAKWIMRHVETKKAKGSYVDETKVKDRPSFTIVSHQPGCNKPLVISIVKTALTRRFYNMKNDVEKWAEKRMK